jgi:SAM-dependent methyltransferase
MQTISGLVSADSLPDEGDAPRYPLMGAWICQTFCPWLMPLLYGLVWAGVKVRVPRESHPLPHSQELVDLALQPYATSLYPVLALALERHHFLSRTDCPLPDFDLGMAATGSPWLRANSVAGETDLSRLQPLGGSTEATRVALVDPQALPFADNSLGTYRLNNAIHSYPDRRPVLEEAYRVLQPGGILQISDVTRGWAESMWPARLADRLGLEKLKRQLIRAKLVDTKEVLIPEPTWWRENLHPTSGWEIVDLRPFFARPSLMLASLFESLNFKQGGPSPIWIEEKLHRHRWLAALYRFLLRGLARLLVDIDEAMTRKTEGAFVMVTLRKRGTPVPSAESPEWRCPACRGPLSGAELNCPSCSVRYRAEDGIARLVTP